VKSSSGRSSIAPKISELLWFDSKSPFSTLAKFLIADLVLVCVIAVGVNVASRSAGTSEAILDVKDRTVILARALPPLNVIDNGTKLSPESFEAVGRMVASERSAAKLLRAKVWNVNGDVLYSDEPELIGQNFKLADDELAAVTSQETIADVTDLTAAENVYEREIGKALQVYLPMESASGQPLLFETYYPFSTVTAAAERYRAAFRSINRGAMLVLTLLQVLLAWVVLRRIRQLQLLRERSLQSAVDSSMLERRRIAGDLHDGVVQELAGLALTLGGTAHRLRTASESTPPKAVEPAIVNAVSDAASEARSAIATLRTLLIDIYPPNLEEEGLEAAIEGLAVGLRNRDIATVVELDPKVELNRSGEALAFRTVQELSRNVQRHSKAQHAWIGIRREGRFTVISVEDDGIGIGDEPVASDHFGTRLLADLADELSGNFEIGPREGGGTVARMEVLSK